MTVVPQSDLDFSGDANRIRALIHGERLSYGHLVNPVFATETALIDPLPHQRIAVYQHMLPQPRLRFLLADDAGAGKTIMAGLYIREMLTRRLIQRILILPPAGLVTNWERELRQLFSLSFRIVTGSEARADNPFVGEDSDHLIISLDTMTGERMMARLQEPSVIPYDLVIFDEAHKLSARKDADHTVRKTGRYRLAEALAGIRADDDRWQLDWGSRHLLLLTATPHMGKDFSYYALWRLLEPEILSTMEAFQAYPSDARRRSFIRRTKEEMVKMDGSPLYPTRVSNTISYDLTQGDISEQALYERTTDYLDQTYNTAQILNRQAARFAMSIFQRRLASSTRALLCSLRRRVAKLDMLIAAMQSGKMTTEQLGHYQQRLIEEDPYETTTADEYSGPDGREEQAEDDALEGVVAETLADLEAERDEVQTLVDLASAVDQSGQESKFTRLRELLRLPQYVNEKMIIFTEHRDTLDFLVQRLQGIGLSGQIATIHGGMNSAERDDQVAFFRRPIEQGGAHYLIATDAAGEGINLQFCWLMVNYDLPWNPARLEQRMGRIHRYGQKHDPVFIINLIAGATREGRVMQTLLAKLETIRKELGSEKVYDVIGWFFSNKSLTDYMQAAITSLDDAIKQLEGEITKEQFAALQAKKQSQYGSSGGNVQAHLEQLQDDLNHEMLRRLLPGSVQRFLETAAPLVGLILDGDLNTRFAIKAATPGAMDAFLPLLERYPQEQRNQFSVQRPTAEDRDSVIFLRPGEPFFDRLRADVGDMFAEDGLRGGLFIDPTTTTPYLLHIAEVSIVRQADPTIPALSQNTILETRLIGIRQQEDGNMQVCPVETILLLKAAPPTGKTHPVILLIGKAKPLREQATRYLHEQVAEPAAEEHRQAMLATLPERLDFLRRGYAYQEAELAETRTRYREKERRGDPRAQQEITRIKQRQRELGQRREAACVLVQREPELVAVGNIAWVAHALVAPTSDPEDHRRHNVEVETLAMRVAWAYEEARGATVRDVSTADQARAADLEAYPGFDLLSQHPSTGERRCIEVKGRAGRGTIELTENEWVRACNLRGRYWLYVVYDCASEHPTLLRVCDPFGKLFVNEKQTIVIGEQAIVEGAE